MAYLVERSMNGRIMRLSVRGSVGGTVIGGTTTGITELEASEVPSAMLVALASSAP